MSKHIKTNSVAVWPWSSRDIKVGHGTLLFLAGLWLCKNAESLRFSRPDGRCGHGQPRFNNPPPEGHPDMQNSFLNFFLALTPNKVSQDHEKLRFMGFSIGNATEINSFPWDSYRIQHEKFYKIIGFSL